MSHKISSPPRAPNIKKYRTIYKKQLEENNQTCRRMREESNAQTLLKFNRYLLIVFIVMGSFIGVITYFRTTLALPASLIPMEGNYRRSDVTMINQCITEPDSRACIGGLIRYRLKDRRVYQCTFANISAKPSLSQLVSQNSLGTSIWEIDKLIKECYYYQRTHKPTTYVPLFMDFLSASGSSFVGNYIQNSVIRKTEDYISLTNGCSNFDYRLDGDPRCRAKDGAPRGVWQIHYHYTESGGDDEKVYAAYLTGDITMQDINYRRGQAPVRNVKMVAPPLINW